jgi:acyl carrier protein
MNTLPDIRSLVFTLLEQRFRLAGIASVDQLEGSFDLFESGVLDSLGFVELMVALDERLGVGLDFSELTTAQVSNFAAFCSFIHDKATADRT